MTKSKKHNPKGKKRNKKSEKAPSFALDSKMTPRSLCSNRARKVARYGDERTQISSSGN